MLSITPINKITMVPTSDGPKMKSSALQRGDRTLFVFSRCQHLHSRTNPRLRVRQIEIIAGRR